MNPFTLVTQLGAWGQSHSQEVLWGLGTVAALGAGSRVIRRWRHGDPTTHGSARWATPREVRKAGLDARAGVVVGRLRGRLLMDNSEVHSLLMGPTRSWKGVSVIGPSHFCWPESVLTLDPKDGENMDISAPWRGQWGQIEAFTPCRSPQTCINVCDTIRLGKFQEFGDAQVIAQSATAPEKMAKETPVSLHFRELATMLLTAAELHVCYTAPPGSMAKVWYFMTQQHESLASCLTAMRSTAHTSYGVHQAIASLTRAIGNITGDRELSSVWSTAIRPLVLYSDPMVAASTDTSTFDLEALQYGPLPVSLYLIAPSPMALRRLHPLYRVILDVALTRLMEHKVRTWTHRLWFCGDELPWWGYTWAIDPGVSVWAGYGIKGLFVTQDFAMLEETYGQHSAIWGNTDLKIFHAPTNDLTAKRISENLIGRGTIDHPVESRQAGLFAQRSVSQQHVARALLTTDEVMELDPTLQLVRKSGCKPILCQKVNYRRDPEFAARRTA
jgi:type IV secretion system protein VirD4